MTFPTEDGRTMLWTVQKRPVLERLLDGNAHVARRGHVRFPPEDDDATRHAHYAYGWLMGQMEAMIGPRPAPDAYPCWAWLKTRGRNDGLPAFRSHAVPSEDDMCLLLEVPTRLMLASDFDDWDLILAYQPVTESDDELERWRAAWAAAGEDVSDAGDWDVMSDNLSLMRSQIEETWARALGVRKKEGVPWRERQLQATTWRIEPRWLVAYAPLANLTREIGRT